MEGISHEACALAGALEARQADRALRRQRHLDRRRRSQPWFIDDTPKRFEAYGWHVIARRRRPRRRCGRRGDRQGARQHRQADADLLQDDDRQGRADARRHGQGARRSARRRRGQGDARGARLAARAVRRCPDEVYAAWDATPSGAAAEARMARVASPPTRAHPRARAPNTPRRMRGRAAGALARASSTRPRSRRTPRPRPSPAARRARSSSRRSRRRCRSCSAAAPT